MFLQLCISKNTDSPLVKIFSRRERSRNRSISHSRRAEYSCGMCYLLSGTFNVRYTNLDKAPITTRAYRQVYFASLKSWCVRLAAHVLVDRAIWARSTTARCCTTTPSVRSTRFRMTDNIVRSARMFPFISDRLSLTVYLWRSCVTRAEHMKGRRRRKTEEARLDLESSVSRPMDRRARF